MRWTNSASIDGHADWKIGSPGEGSAASPPRVAVLGVAATAEAKKKKKKKKKKPSATTCVFPYFACDGECRLEPACCDSIPAKNCASSHAGQGGNWVCCTHAGFGCFDLDNDKLNCNACGHACDANQHCLNGTCLD